MKLRSTLILALISVLLTACNMTLAQDVTPPPGLVQPSPAPTHGAVFPVQAPDLTSGELIYEEKCAPCHGEGGMGDGEQGQQLPVSVPPLALPEIAIKASPAKWFLTVTLGNIDNFMPPFNSLNEQERWDVVAYTLSLSSTPEQIERGELLFNDTCGDCPLGFTSDQEVMAALSGDDLVALLAQGGSGIPALGETLSDDELLDVAAYLRSLSFRDSSLAVEPATAIPTASEASAPAPDVTESAPGEGTPQTQETPEEPSVEEGFGSISGKIVNGSGEDLPPDLSVTLLGFDHSTDATADLQEAFSQTTDVNADGSFSVEGVELPDGRIFFAEVEYQGIPFQSEFAFTEAGSGELVLPELIIYERSSDSSALVIEELFVFSEFNPDGTLRIFEQFYITNQGDSVVEVATDGTTIPILPMPEGVSDLAFQPTQDSADLLPTDSGFAMAPGEQAYGIIAFYTLPYEGDLDLSLPLALPVSTLSVVVPEGIQVDSEILIDQGIREMQPGARFQVYTGDELSASDTLDMTISGKVAATPGDAGIGVVDNSQILLISLGVLGVVLILAGGWLYLRDRKQPDDEEFGEVEEDEFDSAEDVMDAIIALDDLHRAKKIPDKAYRQRRAELKERLKTLA